MDIIVISDSDSDESFLPPLNVTSMSGNEFFSEFESKLKLHVQQAGNPKGRHARASKAKRTNVDSSACHTVGRMSRKMYSTADSPQTYPAELINVISDDEDDFDMQRAITDSLQSFASAMGCQGRHGGHGKSIWTDQTTDKTKTWSRRRAEHAALKIPSPTSDDCPLSDSAIHISSEGSGAEDSDTLPDLDDSFADLQTTAHICDLLHPSESTPKKLRMMGSPRRGKERHFLDTFQPTPKYKRTKEDSKVGKSNDIVKTVKTATNASSGAEISRKRKDRISQEKQAGSAPIYQQEYEVFKFPHDTSSTLSVDRRTPASVSNSRQLRNKFSGVTFLQDLITFPSVMDKLCADFVKMQTACLDDLLNDLSDPTHFSQCMDLLEDFGFQRKPDPMLIEKIINGGFFGAADEDMLVRTYHSVLKQWQRFPDLIKIDVQLVLMCGDVLQKYLQNSMSSSETGGLSWSRWRGPVIAGKPNVQQCRLYFQLFVKGLQLSLSQCTLADQKSVNKSLAFACLSSEGSKTLIKQLTHWLEFCLVPVVMHQEHVAMAKMWMCELQTLLGMSVLVSRDQHEAAKRLAREMRRTYKYLTDLGTKKRLLQSFACPLLCFYVLRLIMEDQCESTIVSSQFPSTIEEVIHNYYVALPPQDQDHLTPPPSPSEDGHERYSVQSCEELAMLIYFITKSFITCKQKRLNCDLRQQILKGPCLHILTPEQKRHFERSIRDLGGHLRALCLGLSAATATYLNVLECLCLTL